MNGSLAERFWAKVQKTETCWLWTGASNPLGYGQIVEGGNTRKLLRATAVSLMLAGVDVPPGADICHRCDNPPCVNPDHLFIGTAVDNMRDCIAKGRFKFPTPRRGEVNNKAKLTWSLVEDIRRAYASGESLSDLSRRLGMARSTLREVVMGRNWKVPGVPVKARLKPTKKLTEADYAEIRRRRLAGETTVSLGAVFGIHQGGISRIMRRA